MGALPNDIRDALSNVRIARLDLHELQMALRIIGMTPLAEKLEYIACELSVAHDKVMEIADNSFNQWCGQVEQSSANVLRAALAGAELAARSQNVRHEPTSEQASGVDLHKRGDPSPKG